jgi:flagellar basal body-associated protein FliL
MALKKFANALNEKGNEGEIIKTIIISIVVGLAAAALVYFFIIKNNPALSKYSYYLFIAAVSYGFLVSSVKYLKAYRAFSCMSGMMIGMTIGMESGFLAGMFIGATNGMFFGGIFGIVIGCLFGIWTGSCCGVMGFMEGIMAGFMGGLMGAMTSVMLLNDHLNIAVAFFALICIIILVSLDYMVFQDTKERESDRKDDHFITLIISLVLMASTAWMILYGPRGGVFI